MKQIIAIVKPFLAEKVLAKVQDVPVEAVQVREVRGYGRQKSYLDKYTDSEFSEAFLPKVEITVWVADQDSDHLLQRIVEVARTGRIGDGKIMIVPVTAMRL